MDFRSTTYIMLIGQFYKWLKMWLEAVFRLITSSGGQGKMASKRSLYFGNFLSNKLFQKSTLESTIKSNSPTPKIGNSTSLFCWSKKVMSTIDVLITFSQSIEKGPIKTLQLGKGLPITTLKKMTLVVIATTSPSPMP